jgi:YMGG-like Gly-zipper
MKTTASLILLGFTLSSCIIAPRYPYGSNGSPTAVGAVTGATAGAIIGNQSNQPVEGAIIGGAIGALAGAALSQPRPYYGAPNYQPPYYGSSYCPPRAPRQRW